MKTFLPSRFWIKVFSLFTVIRGYNIAVLIIAQYLTSSYILAPNTGLLNVIFDSKLFALVLATAFSTAAGYIINNFYDAEKDKINRPKKYLLENLISQQSQLIFYFLLNGATLIAAGFVSFNSILFFFTDSFKKASSSKAAMAALIPKSEGVNGSLTFIILPIRFEWEKP